MTALESLGEYCGIVDRFIDANDTEQRLSDETRRALLAAMGVVASDEAGALCALTELRTQEARRCLPPVHVHVAGTPLDIVFKDPDGLIREWWIGLEDGGALRGSLPRPLEANRETSAPAQQLLRVKSALPLGYHTLHLEPGNFHCSLIVTPGQCWLPDGLDAERKLWGVAVQVFLLRSQTGLGIGDFRDLKELTEGLASRGGDVVGVNPLHAMFPDAPEHASPYSPASRLLLNILNIDVASLVASLNCEAARAAMASAPFQAALADCRASRLVDYSAVSALKLPLLRMLFDCCDRQSAEWQRFLDFRGDAGAAFERSCLFLALRDQFAATGPQHADWHAWPDEYRTPDSEGSRGFAETQAEAVTYQAWLQYTADRQLQQCSEAAGGMAVGLYRDLAVGAALEGAETWANADAVVEGVHVGAPPDIYNPQGQDWGLPPFDPRALRQEGYRSFIDLVRANMRHAGGLRIDHVMALQQLFWVPHGRHPSEGGYVRYPLEDLVGILALESHRQRCLVVGEDLGTVPAGFRERMERARILSYRVCFFEKEKEIDDFIVPENYPMLALAVAGSHDLPTLRAWWQGADLVLKRRLDLYPSAALAKTAADERDVERNAMEALLRHRGLLGDALDVESFVDAMHAFLASTNCAVAMVQLDDMTGEVEPVNVPTTSDENPNWRRRSSVTLEELTDDPRFIATTTALRAARGRPGRPS